MIKFTSIICYIFLFVPSSDEHPAMVQAGHLCNNRCAFQKETIPTSKVNCKCDDQCGVYGDCCVDSPYLYQNVEKRKDVQCRDFQEGPIYLVDNCNKKWSGPEVIKERCLVNFTNSWVKDPLTYSPATNLLTNTTYKSYYCAICNNDYNTVRWPVAMSYNGVVKYNTTYKNVTIKHILNNLEYHSEDYVWGVQLWEQQTLKFYPISFKFRVPNRVEPKIRHCISSVSNCATNWTCFIGRYLCDSYSDPISYYGVTYRNIHCAVCNYVDVCNESALSCEILSQTPEVQRNVSSNGTEETQTQATVACEEGEQFDNDTQKCTKPKEESKTEEEVPTSFNLLFDFNFGEGNAVGTVTEDVCKEGEKYDPFVKKCRNIVCGVAGYVRRDNACVPE